MQKLRAIAAVCTFMLAAPSVYGDPAIVIHPGTGTCGVLDIVFR
jgi:hypothetical protein